MDSPSITLWMKLDNAPEPGYQFKEYVIHQVGDTAVKVQPLGNYFTMPDFDVEVSAVFEKSEGDNQQQQQQQDQTSPVSNSPLTFCLPTSSVR